MLLFFQTESANAPNWNIIIPSILSGLTAIILAYIAYKTAQAKTSADNAALKAAEVAIKAEEVADKVANVALKAKDVADKVSEVQTHLEESTTKADAQRTRIEDTGKKTHILVNSNMSEQLKISALALRRVADLTGDQNDVMVAEAAESAYAGHESKQAVVDAAEKRNIQ